jgi:hypothetical protein
MMLVLLANLFLVAFRFWRGMRHFGISLPWNVASQASLVGHLSGLVVISFFGQVIGRQAVLQAYDVPSVVTAAFLLYERMMMLVVGSVFAAPGAGWLFGRQVIADALGSISLIEILIAAGAGMGVSWWFGRSQVEKNLLVQVLTVVNLRRWAEIGALSAIGQCLMFLCFVIGIQAVAPSYDLISLFAAAAVISFAAALPITINGWGVRELVSVYVLGRLGVPEADAVAVSIVVGLCSTLAILIPSVPFLLKQAVRISATEPVCRTSSAGAVHPPRDLECYAAWVLSIATSILVFFQVHVVLPGGLINVNLADPLAIGALAAVGLRTAVTHQFPSWRIGHVNLALSGITVLLVAGFVRGWVEIGLSQWALMARLMGWLVLLGYMSAGYLLVANVGAQGLRRLVETLASTATVIVIVEVCIRIITEFVAMPGLTPRPNFQGHAGNRNAFAVQLLTALAVWLGYAIIYTRGAYRSRRLKRLFVWTVFLGALLCGVIWSGSRTGIGVSILLLIACWWMHTVDHKHLLAGVGVAVAFWVAMWCVHNIAPNVVMQSEMGNDASDKEHWGSLLHAIELWRESPIIGSGLGVFYAKSATWFGHPVVVHSTPLWILTEFGLLGVVVVGGTFVLLTTAAMSAKSRLPVNRSLLWVLAVVALFGLVHEIFYQRIVWLILGALLATPLAMRYPAKGNPRGYRFSATKTGASHRVPWN